MKLTGENRSTRGKTCPSATLSTTNPTWTDPGLNPDLRGERPATNRQSHGTALHGMLQGKLHLCYLLTDIKYLNILTSVTVRSNICYVKIFNSVPHSQKTATSMFRVIKF